MTQLQLATKIDTDPTRISEYENGRKVVSAEMASDFAKGLGVAEAVALIEAGYITDLPADVAALAAEIALLSDRDRAIIAVLVAAMRQRLSE